MRERTIFIKPARESQAGFSDPIEALVRSIEDVAGLEVRHTAVSPYAYASSHRLLEVELSLQDGSHRTFIVKDLSPGAVTPEAVRPVFVSDPVREIDSYRRLLDGLGIAPDCVMTYIDVNRNLYWLAVEKVAGVELWQVGELETWKQAARWLARLHHALAPGVSSGVPSLIRHDARYHEIWARRALTFAGPPELPRVRSLLSHHDEIVRRLLELPSTVIHGDCFASNILVERVEGTVRGIRAIDWEMTSIGPALYDLAALVAGHWSEDQRLAIARSYYEERAGGSGFEAFRDQLDLCRLQLCIQSLGWAPGWQPPEEHVHDWLAEAVELSRRLGLSNSGQSHE